MLNIDIPSGYHISKGATNDFYILNDGEIFIRNLSKNLSDAKSKAEKLIKEKNSYITLQDKEIDTLKGQIDLKDLEIEMLKKKNG